MTTVDRIGDAVARWGPVAGAGRLRTALARVRVGVESRYETETRLLIVDAGLPEPVVQFRVVHDDGWVDRVDLAYPELKIAIEYEGAHHFELSQARKDVARIRRLQAAGWIVIRATIDDINRPTALITAIATARAERGG